MKKNSIHFAYNRGDHAVFQLLMCHDRESVCIDKTPAVEAALRLTLAHHGLNPFTVGNIHCWKVETIHKIHYFFVDDEQNELVKQGFNTACDINTTVEPEQSVC